MWCPKSDQQGCETTQTLQSTLGEKIILLGIIQMAPVECGIVLYKAACKSSIWDACKHATADDRPPILTQTTFWESVECELSKYKGWLRSSQPFFYGR